MIKEEVSQATEASILEVAKVDKELAENFPKKVYTDKRSD